AHEDRVVARTGAVLDAAPDLCRDPVGLLPDGGEGVMPERHGVALHPPRPQPLRDPDPHLQAIWIVEPDEAMRAVEDRRQRSVVAPGDDRLRAAVGGAAPAEGAGDI